MSQTVGYLGLGTNLGDRQKNLARAVKRLNAKPDLAVVRTSGIYETSPWGLTEQPDFLNMVAEITTSLSPQELLDRIKDLERELGRKHGPRFGPRLIDVDILLYGDLSLDEPELQIPHPQLHLRAFALAPLAELAPSLVHPVLNDTIGHLAENVEGLEGLKPLGPLS